MARSASLRSSEPVRIECALCRLPLRSGGIGSHLFSVHPELSQRTHALVGKQARDQARGWVPQPAAELLILARMDSARSGRTTRTKDHSQPFLEARDEHRT